MPGPPVPALRALARLVLPVACPGCGRLDVLSCSACTASLTAGPHRVETAAPHLDRVDGAAPLPVWALAAYAGPVRRQVLAWKDRGRVDLDRVLAPPLRRAAAGVAPPVAAAVAATAPGPVLVVPAPSTGRARRARGRDHVTVLARAVASGLADAAVPARVTPALRRRGRSLDQVGLGARARARNLAGRVVVRRAARDRVRRAPCLLVDDVVTTGATLAAAERALEAAGAVPVAGLVVAATPPPGLDGTFANTLRVPVPTSREVGLAWGSDGG
ncbi:ComF family protein [Isoptericola sp. BMS4]|uniref:ComF family protein n=1 Tax=Isoptericola sp. BMS4 TaxID=2527875 RepID=UPI001420ACEA|nr:ComF family protein [Isoptericola sp. BMS4]